MLLSSSRKPSSAHGLRKHGRERSPPPGRAGLPAPNSRPGFIPAAHMPEAPGGQVVTWAAGPLPTPSFLAMAGNGASGPLLKDICLPLPARPLRIPLGAPSSSREAQPGCLGTAGVAGSPELAAWVRGSAPPRAGGVSCAMPWFVLPTSGLGLRPHVRQKSATLPRSGAFRRGGGEGARGGLGRAGQGGREQERRVAPRSPFLLPDL